MTRYSKDDVQTHSDGYRPSNPAVNVKAYSFPSSDSVMERFGCSEKTAEKALEYAFEAQREDFWETIAEKDEIAFYFADFPGRGKVEIYSEGRSGGWLVVHGLPDIADWDAIALAKWHKFERDVKAEIEYRCSQEAVFELIEMNEWAMDRDSINALLAAIYEATIQNKVAEFVA